MTSTCRVEALYRYPVKGLSPEPLERVRLEAGDYFPGDRLFAVENGPSGFDPSQPRHEPKIKFLMLMRNERLAQLRTRFDDLSGELVIEPPGGKAVRGDLSTQDGREAIEDFFQHYMRYELRGAPRVLAAPSGYRFTDSARGFVSIINRASVQAIEEMLGRPVDPLRFRANILVEGLEPWGEFGLVGQILESPAGLRIEITHRTERCAATNVDPLTGLRDLDIPKLLQRRLGHADCGVYGRVIADGPLSVGERLDLAPVPPVGALPFGG